MIPAGFGDGDAKLHGEDDLGEIEQRALRMLAGREHNKSELRRKLSGRGFSAEAIEAVLHDLEQRGLFSERRYIESYIVSRQNKGFGPMRILAELRERGVESTQVPADLAAQLDPGAAHWWDRMVAADQRRFGPEPPGDRRELGRRARFLQQRGFPPDMIRRLLWDNENG